MSLKNIPFYEPNSQANKRSVRAGIWLLAGISLGLLFVTILILSFVEPATPQGAAVNEAANPMMDPLQMGLNIQEPILLQEDNVTWQMNPRAEFSISARIVGKKEYRDWQAAFAPIDLLVAWGELSNPQADQWITWRQSGRSGRYNQSSSGPFTGNYIISHASNIHIIPATENLEMAINGLERDQVILLEGLLVDVNSNKGSVNTSLTRTDSGPDSCEILYVQRLVVDGMEYR